MASKLDQVLSHLAKQDTILARIDATTQAHANAFVVVDKRLDAHAADIKSLNRWRAWATGIGTAVCGLFGIKLSQ